MHIPSNFGSVGSFFELSECFYLLNLALLSRCDCAHFASVPFTEHPLGLARKDSLQILQLGGRGGGWREEEDLGH